MPETDRVGRAQRILVYGAAGSGKSKMAGILSELTGILATSVDDICWRPGWVPMSKEEQIATFDRITRADAWILDSAYGSWRDLALERADLVVALDYARMTSLARLLRRTARRLIDQQEVCNGNRETWRGVFARDSIVVWHFTSYRRKRAEIRAWAAASSGPPVIRLDRPVNARAFAESGVVVARTSSRRRSMRSLGPAVWRR